MAVKMENFGLKLRKEQYFEINDYVFDNGWFIEGYTRPYNNYEFGSLQVIIRKEVKEIDDNGVRYLTSTGMDTHIRGMAIWELRSRGIDLTPEKNFEAERRYCFSNAKTGQGLVVVNIVNADVIPSYRKDEIIKMQVVFFPNWLSYYESEEAIEREVKNDQGEGIRLDRGMGEVSAIGLRYARSRQTGDNIDTDGWDPITDLKAMITNVSFESVQIDEATKGEYVRCTVDTEFGPLEVVHDIGMVREEERKNIQEGCFIYATGIISADPAIGEYESGIIKDETNNYKLLCDIFEGGDPERLRAILADDAVYESELSETLYTGADAIIDRISDVQKTGHKYYAEMGNIVSIDDGESELPLREGDRCITLSAKQRRNFESLAFINLNDGGEITRIHTTANPRLFFRVDQPLEDIELYYAYDPDGIPMNLTFASIGLDQYFAFGFELDRFIEDGTRTGRLTWSYDHENMYDVRHEDDLCYVSEYEVDYERKRIEFQEVVPLGNNDRSIWDAIIAMQPKESGSGYRKRFVILRRKDNGKGLAVLKLVEAGLYPSYMEGDEIQIRVTAFPGRMGYFETEEELMEELHDENGKPIDLIADGVVRPTVFFRTHDEEHRHEKHYDDDNIHLVRGIVTEILPGRIPTIYDNEVHFIRCYINTEFGDMEILHTEEMISEEQRKNMRPGAIVYGVFELYGNPAFGEHEYGIIGNEENNLRKLREVLVTGAAKELYEILDDNAEVIFDGEDAPGVKGRDEVIRYLKNFCDLIETCSSADMARVDQVDVDGHQTMIPGRRCIAFAEVAGGEYTSIWFIENNDKGNIVRITYGMGNGYGLKIDPKPVFDQEDDLEAVTNGVH